MDRETTYEWVSTSAFVGGVITGLLGSVLKSQGATGLGLCVMGISMAVGGQYILHFAIRKFLR